MLDIVTIWQVGERVCENGKAGSSEQGVGMYDFWTQ